MCWVCCVLLCCVCADGGGVCQIGRIVCDPAAYELRAAPGCAPLTGGPHTKTMLPAPGGGIVLASSSLLMYLVVCVCFVCNCVVYVSAELCM